MFVLFMFNDSIMYHKHYIQYFVLQINLISIIHLHIMFEVLQNA